ncbi:MAG: mechanosensitive ion channel family protein [Candidatus Kariarchaeaceae archaeon]|jgi:hypothetical protein
MWYVDTSPPLILKILLFTITISLIWLGGRLLKRRLDKRSTRRNFEAKNLVKLLISTAQLILVILATLFIFEVESTTFLSFSALIGTTIGFGLAVAVGNVVAGFYLIGVRPFGIGDFIQVGSIEGIVTEIGLNYTKLIGMDSTVILVPNKTLLDAKLLNCTMRLRELEGRSQVGHDLDFDQLASELSYRDGKGFFQEFKQELSESDEFTKYSFQIQLKLNIVSPDIALSSVVERMDALCKRWKKQLGFMPRYYFGKNIFRQDMQVILVASEPITLVHNHGAFLADLYQSVFAELQEVTT